MIRIYNYLFGYGEVKCCNCGFKMTVKNPNPNALYSCSNGCTFEAYNRMQKNENKNENNNENKNENEKIEK